MLHHPVNYNMTWMDEDKNGIPKQRNEMSTYVYFCFWVKCLKLSWFGTWTHGVFLVCGLLNSSLVFDVPLGS